MPLADALAPEGVARAVRKHGVRIHAVEGEQARIPAAGDESRVAGLLRGLVDGGKMLRNPRVRVKAVHHVEQGRAARRLLRQIGGAAAAEDQHVETILPLRQDVRRKHRHIRRKDRHAGRIAPRKDSGQLHIAILPHGALHAASQVAIAQNTNTNHVFLPIPFFLPAV